MLVVAAAVVVVVVVGMPAPPCLPLVALRNALPQAQQPLCSLAMQIEIEGVWSRFGVAGARAWGAVCAVCGRCR